MVGGEERHVARTLEADSVAGSIAVAGGVDADEVDTGTRCALWPGGAGDSGRALRASGTGGPGHTRRAGCSGGPDGSREGEERPLLRALVGCVAVVRVRQRDVARAIPRDGLAEAVVGRGGVRPLHGHADRAGRTLWSLWSAEPLRAGGAGEALRSGGSGGALRARVATLAGLAGKPLQTLRAGVADIAFLRQHGPERGREVRLVADVGRQGDVAGATKGDGSADAVVRIYEPGSGKGDGRTLRSGGASCACCARWACGARCAGGPGGAGDALRSQHGPVARADAWSVAVISGHQRDVGRAVEAGGIGDRVVGAGGVVTGVGEARGTLRTLRTHGSLRADRSLGAGGTGRAGKARGAGVAGRSGCSGEREERPLLRALVGRVAVVGVDQRDVA